MSPYSNAFLFNIRKKIHDASLESAQYIIWSKFHIQTTTKKQTLKKGETHTYTHIHTVEKTKTQTKLLLLQHS